MALSRKKLVKFLNQQLNIYDYKDYGPNGLQVEGREEIQKVAFAVSATAASISEAISQKADTLIVHHGLFWKFHGYRTVTGPFAGRLKPLIQHDVNLLGYHLPLDAHLEYGNAARVALLLGLENLEPFGDYQGMPTGVKGIFPAPKSADQLKNELEELLDHTVIHAQGDQEEIQSMGIITGGANGDWVSAWREGLDSYLTGEISEHDWHESSEAGIHMFAGGHNATESFGIQALQKLVEKHFEVETLYIPSSNPA